MQVLGSRTVSVLKLQQRTGLLNFISTVILPGRTFTRRMYMEYACLNLKQHYHLNIDHELKGDCLVWLKFLNNPE